MTTTQRLPADVNVLLKFIRLTEVGRSDPKTYDVIFGHREKHLPKPVTKMTLKEVQSWQAKTAMKSWVWTNWGYNTSSSATGAYQFMYKTLGGIIEELNLDTSLKFDVDMQDDLAWFLLRRRGLDAWRFGKIDDVEFAKRLAQEWASFPVLENTRGAHRIVMRGQSYYTGDALNKALVTPEQVEALLVEARKARVDQGEPIVRPKDTKTKDTSIGVGVGAGGAAVAVGVGAEAANETGVFDSILESAGIFGASGSTVVATIGAVLVLVVTGAMVYRMFFKKDKK